MRIIIKLAIEFSKYPKIYQNFIKKFVYLKSKININ